MDQMNIVCVLKSGGDFTPEHVVRLYEQVKARMTVDFEFWCLSDYPRFSFPPGIRLLALCRNWPGWWSKLEVFDFFVEALYLDLDTNIIGPIDDIARPRSGFFALRDLDTVKRPEQLASGVMRWKGDYSFITRQFSLNPQSFMDKHRDPLSWGDQGFIQAALAQSGVDHLYLQDFHPGRIVSYKLYVARGASTEGVSIICHHGKPRPWEVAL